jgi:hypothetical protein
VLEAASGGRSDSCRGDRGGVSLATWPWSERARGEWAVAAVAGAILGAARGLVMRLYPARVACIDGAGLWLSGTAPLEVFSLLGMTVRDDRLMSGTLAALLRLYKLGLLLAGVALLLLVGRAPDAEANSWVVQQAASPPPVPAGNFSVVSCPSTGYCAAVGVGPIGFLAAAWNGAAWRSTSIPTPVDVNSPRLTALSCASRSFSWRLVQRLRLVEGIRLRRFGPVGSGRCGPPRSRSQSEPPFYPGCLAGRTRSAWLWGRGSIGDIA